MRLFPLMDDKGDIRVESQLDGEGTYVEDESSGPGNRRHNPATLTEITMQVYFQIPK